jgi:pheromone shutdown protein TraB
MVRDAFRKRQVSIHPSDEVVLELLAEMRVHYPRIYKVMVEERDKFMAGALVHLAEKYPEKTIVAIVGKGHVPGMLSQIKYLNKDVAVSLWTSPAKN